MKNLSVGTFAELRRAERGDWRKCHPHCKWLRTQYLRVQFSQHPSFGEGPLALNSFLGAAQERGDFTDLQAGEDAQLYDLGLLGMSGCQPVERFVDLQAFVVVPGNRQIKAIQLDAFQA